MKTQSRIYQNFAIVLNPSGWRRLQRNSCLHSCLQVHLFQISHVMFFGLSGTRSYSYPNIFPLYLCAQLDQVLIIWNFKKRSFDHPSDIYSLCLFDRQRTFASTSTSSSSASSCNGAHNCAARHVAPWPRLRRWFCEKKTANFSKTRWFRWILWNEETELNW